MFAWKIIDMPRVDPEVMCHNLRVRVGAKPVKHKVRKFHPEHQVVNQEKVTSLFEAKFTVKFLSRLVVKCGISSKEMRKVTTLHKLQKFKWHLLK